MSGEKKSPSWTFLLKSGDFSVELKESVLKRMDWGACSTYVDPVLIHLGLAHALEKSYRGRGGDEYEIVPYQEDVETLDDAIKDNRGRKFTGPTFAPKLRAVRNLAIYLAGGSGQGPSNYGLCAYDEQTMILALPNGDVLFVWTHTFRQCLDTIKRSH